MAAVKTGADAIRAALKSGTTAAAVKIWLEARANVRTRAARGSVVV